MNHIILASIGLLGANLSISLAEGGEVVRTGKHYRIVCHSKNITIAAAALRTAEDVWAVAGNLFGVDAAAPSSPLPIHLLRSVDDYKNVERKLTGGRFQSNLAFTHRESRSAHIVMQPMLPDQASKTLGLTALTQRLVAHEAAHLWRYAAIPNHKSHPEWLATGAATWIADEVVRRLGDAGAPESKPLTSTYVVRLQRLAVQKRLPSIERILADDLQSLKVDERYATQWMLFRFMLGGNHRDAWMELMAEARRLGGGRGYRERLTSAVTEKLAPNKWGGLNAEFGAFVQSLRPEWEEVHRSLEISGPRWVQSAFPQTNAIAWRTELVGSDHYRITGEFNLIPLDHKQFNLLLGRDEGGFVSIAFVGDYGVTVFRYSSGGNRWDKLGELRMRKLTSGRWIRFKVQVADGQVSVSIGKDKLTAPLNGRSMTGPFGVGAQAGSAGTWRSVALRRD